MNSIQQQRFMQLRERRRKKGYLTIDTDEEEASFPLSTKMDSATYSNAFNAYVTDLKRNEYKTKNPNLFTWNRTLHYMNKLSFVPEHSLNFPQQVSSVRVTQDTVLEEPKVSDPSSLTKPSLVLKSSASKPAAQKIQLENLSLKSLQTRSKTPIEKPQKVPDLDLDKLETFYKESPQYTKKSYPITKLQTDLLTNRSEDVLANIPNSEYMLNHFNKRNQALNKIISQVNADKKMLDKDEVLKETILKLEVVSNSRGLHKNQRPNANLFQATQAEPIRESSSPKKNMGYESSDQKNKIKINGLEPLALIKQPSLKKGMEIGFTQMNTPAAADDENVKASARSSRKKSARVFVKGKREVKETNILKKRETDALINKRKKEEDIDIVKNLEYGLQQLDQLYSIKDLERCESLEQRHFLQRGQTFITRTVKRSETNVPRVKTEEDEPVLKLSGRMNDENIFYYSSYFKKKYMENGLSMEVSANLKSRIANFEKDVKSAINRIQHMDIK